MDDDAQKKAFKELGRKYTWIKTTECLKNIKECIQNDQGEQKFNEAIVKLSKYIGYKTMKRVLNIVDKKHIKIFKSAKTGRQIAQMDGTAYRNGYRPTYYLLPDTPHCNCQFVMKRIMRAKRHFCKHFLALQIAMFLGKCEIVEVSRDEYIKISKRFSYFKKDD